MKTTLSAKTLNTGIHPEIEKLDLSRIKYKLMENNDISWTFEDCERAEMEYKRFLTLVKLFPQKEIVPSNLMDKFWHQHILDTVSYEKDCKKLFGYFLHHFPYFGIYGKDDKINLENAFEETKRIYQTSFGESIEESESSRCKGHPCHAPSSCACRAPGTCKKHK